MADGVKVEAEAAWQRVAGRGQGSLEGHYFDKKHGGCLRFIHRLSGAGRYMIRGVYGNDELAPPGTPWTAIVYVRESDAKKEIPLKVDFSAGKKKPGEKDLVMEATFALRTKKITWADGNVWVPCYCHPQQFAGGSQCNDRDAFIGGNRYITAMR